MSLIASVAIIVLRLEPHIAWSWLALLAWTALVKAQPQLEHPVEHLGLIAIMVCVLGRAWCSLYIGGRWLTPAGRERIPVLNPATEAVIGSIVDADQVLVTTAVASDVPEVLHGARFDVGGGNVMAHEEVLDER